MNKLYNKAFNVGVLFVVLLFSILNFISYLIAYKRHIGYKRDAKIFGVGGFPAWGFPFSWGDGQFNIMWFGNEVLNFIILAICGFAFGFLFRFVWSKISSRRVGLK